MTIVDDGYKRGQVFIGECAIEHKTVTRKTDLNAAGFYVRRKAINSGIIDFKFVPFKFICSRRVFHLERAGHHPIGARKRRRRRDDDDDDDDVYQVMYHIINDTVTNKLMT